LAEPAAGRAVRQAAAYPVADFAAATGFAEPDFELPDPPLDDESEEVDAEVLSEDDLLTVAGAVLDDLLRLSVR